MKISEKKIKAAVLMSTYNGEKYVREQIESILTQEDVDVALHIRDDGSNDGTVSILEEYQRKYGNVDYYMGENKKPCRSFLELIYTDYEADYYALADQDDYWDSKKLIQAIKKIEESENYSAVIPTMYHSNLRVVDSELKYYRMAHSKPHVPRDKYSAVIENLATGCTIVYNKATSDLLKGHKVADFPMHDSLIFMACAFFGRIIYDESAYISYRQHGNNVVGISLGTNESKAIIEKIKRVLDKNFQPRYKSAIIFMDAFGDDLEQGYRRKMQKVVDYKKSVKNRLSLLTDRQLIPSSSFEAMVRFKILILLGLV